MSETNSSLPPETPAPEPTIGNQYLANIPEEDRPIVEKYINEWDKTVTQKFQGIHDEYKWVKDLGTQEELAAARKLFDWVDQNPQELYERLGQALMSETGNGTQGQPTPQVQSTVPEELSEILPPAFLEQTQQTTQQVEALAKWVNEQQQMQQQAQEDAALDAYLKDLHKNHGDFDDDYVISKMYRGAKPEDAITEFNNLVQNRVNQATQNQAAVPPFLSSGSIPATTVDPSKLSRSDAKALFAHMLEQASKSGQ